jgi:hypothetical protein
MPITPAQLQECIHEAGFPTGKRQAVMTIIEHGLQGYREYKTRSYIGPKGKPIKKPTTTHHPPAGRPNQECARTVLISALSRAWIYGFGKKPTLNHKKDPDTPFFNFAARVMALEGIGKIHQHLETYWSVRKKAWRDNDPT